MLPGAFRRRRDDNLYASAVAQRLRAGVPPQSSRAATNHRRSLSRHRGRRRCGTLGLAELSENAVANAWSSDVGKFAVSLSFSCSHSSSSFSSSTTTTSFAGFFFVLFCVLFALGLVFVLPGLYQLLSNAFGRTCISSFEPELSPARAFPLPDDRRLRGRGRCFTGTCARQAGWTVQG